MSNYRTLSAEPRTHFKKGPTRRLRKSGKIPAVIYSQDMEPVTVSLDAHDFNKIFKEISESTIITIQADGENHDVLIKDYQQDILTGRFLHVDFYEVEMGRTLRTNVPIQLVGDPVGVQEGGILETPLHDLEVECLPKDIPEHIEIDVSELGVNDAIHVSDVSVPESVTVLNSEDQTVAMVGMVREEPEPAAEEELVAEGEEALEEGEEAEETEEEEAEEE